MKNKVNEYNFVTENAVELEDLASNILARMFGMQNMFNFEVLSKLQSINTDTVEHFNISVTENPDIASGYLNESVGKSIVQYRGMEIHVADYRSEIFVSSEQPIIKGKITCSTDDGTVTSFEACKAQFNKNMPFVALRCRYKNDEVTNTAILHSIAVQIYVPKNMNRIKRLRSILKLAA